jgi:hypothetical protein
MESMESQKAGFSPFPTLFGNPSGIPTFPRPRRLDSCLLITPSTRNHGRRKGLVTDVSGPQRNACPGTLTPSMSLFQCQGHEFTDRAFILNSECVSRNPK